MSARRGYTILEVVVSLMLLMTAATVAGRVMHATLVERLRSDERLAALTLAENAIEAARATPFDRLTPEWAAALKPDEESAAQLPELDFQVRVEPLAGRVGVKRVDVRLRWRQTGPDAPVRLTAYLADAAGTGR